VCARSLKVQSDICFCFQINSKCSYDLYYMNYGVPVIKITVSKLDDDSTV
jgi:hypothetical protein